MLKIYSRSGIVVASLMLAGLTACGAGDKTPTTAGSDTMNNATADTGAAVGAASTDAKMSPGTAGSSQIAVTNPMPHDMIVSADWGQGQQELGTVKPNETKTFDVAAAGGTQVSLVATDVGKTHSPSGSITLGANGAAAAWTIQ